MAWHEARPLAQAFHPYILPLDSRSSAHGSCSRQLNHVWTLTWRPAAQSNLGLGRLIDNLGFCYPPDRSTPKHTESGIWRGSCHYLSDLLGLRRSFLGNPHTFMQILMCEYRGSRIHLFLVPLLRTQSGTWSAPVTAKDSHMARQFLFIY